MKLAIVGAGAIGGYAGGQLAHAGIDVSLVARGAHLAAIRERGLTVRSKAVEYTVRPFASAEPADIGPVDAVLLAVKAQQLTAVAPRLAPLLGPDTPVITAQNGLPWWYFQKHGGPLEGTRLESVDPGGVLSRTIAPERIIGCVVYCSTVIAEPGVIGHVEGNRFSIGELDGARSERCERIAQVFQEAGLRCPIRTRLRHDIWVKLIGNLAFNPISALTRATMDRMLADPLTNALVREVMAEGAAVAAAVGMPLEISIDERMAGAARVGAHKTSMLQDLEAGKDMEIGAIVGSVMELADRLRISVPHIRTVYALVHQLSAESC